MKIQMFALGRRIDVFAGMRRVWFAGAANVRFARAALLALAVVPGISAVAQDWPTMPLPDDAQVFGVGEKIVTNGTPLQVRAFVSRRPFAEVAAWFRQSLGKVAVENTVKNKLVLGRQVGEYYQTVQLESSSTGTRGLTAVTPLKPEQQNHAETRARLGRWLARMPAGTKVMTDMSSQDGAKVSLYLVATNTQSETLNRDRLAVLMAEDGYSLEREGQPDEKTDLRLSDSMANSRTLFFKGPGKEAVATIHRDSAGRTAIVLNTVTQLEQFN